MWKKKKEKKNKTTPKNKSKAQTKQLTFQLRQLSTQSLSNIPDR